jgi:hypothetical protein
MFEFKNQSNFLKPEVIAQLDPIKSGLKALNNGLTKTQIIFKLNELITSNIAKLEKMERDYNPNAQACYKYIFSKMQKGLVSETAKEYFAHKDNPLAKILSQPYQIEAKEKASQKKDKPLGIMDIMFSERGLILDGGFFDGMFSDAHKFYKAIFDTTALGVSGIVRSGKALASTARFAGKVGSKVIDAFSNNNNPPPTTPTTP